MNTTLSYEDAQRLADVFDRPPAIVRCAWDEANSQHRDAMKDANIILGGYSVESVSCAGRSMEYINTGETYDITICREGDEVFLSSWGVWLEQTEAEHCKEEGVVRCGYCGGFTTVTEGVDWSEVECEHCGNCITG